MVKNAIKEVFHKIENAFEDAYVCYLKLIGHPHIFVLYNNKPIFIFVANKILPYQQFFCDSIKENGGYVIIADNADTIISEIQSLNFEVK